MLLKCRRPGRKPFCAGPLPGTANEYIMVSNVNVRERGRTKADSCQVCGAKSVQTTASCIPKLTEIIKIYLLILVDREGPVAGCRISQISREEQNERGGVGK